MSENSNEQIQCPNCQQFNAIEAKYCQYCGQKTKLRILSVWSMMADFFANLINYDSKTLSSIRGLFIPGFLTQEYIANRRVSYLAPIRLYIFLMLAFFALLSYQGLDQMSFNDNTTDKNTDNLTSVKQEYSLLEQSYSYLKLQTIFDNLKHEILRLSKLTTQKITSKQSKISIEQVKKEPKVKKINKYNKQLASLNDELKQFNQAIKQLESLELIKTIHSKNSEETLELKLFFEKTYSIKLTDISTLSTSELIEKYKIESKIEKIIFTQLIKFNQDAKAFGRFLFQNLTWVSLLEILMFALAFKLFYFSSKKKYVEHFIFQLNIRSLLYFVACISLLIPFELSSWVYITLFIAAALYLFLSMKKVYRQSYFMTVVKFSLLSFIYLFILLIAFTSVLFAASLLF